MRILKRKKRKKYIKIKKKQKNIKKESNINNNIVVKKIHKHKSNEGIIQKNEMKRNIITGNNIIINEKEKKENINHIIEEKNIQDSISNNNMIKKPKKEKDVIEKRNSKSNKNIKEEKINKIKPKLKLSHINSRKLTPVVKIKRYNTTNNLKEKSFNKAEKIGKSIENKINNNDKNQSKDIKNEIKIEEKKEPIKSLEEKDLDKKEDIPLVQQKSEELFNPNDFQLLAVLGEGEYGKIYLTQKIKGDNKISVIIDFNITMLDTVKKAIPATKDVETINNANG